MSVLAGVVTYLVAAGCGGVPNRILIETFNEPLSPRKYVTHFTEAYFARAADGGLDILLNWKQPTQADPTQEMQQVVFAHAFWTPRPGTTRAETSMLNATLRLMILTPPTGVGYAGAGFLTFTLSRDGTVLDGTIESGELAPATLAGGATPPFGPARISGRIRAAEDRRRVVRLLQEAELKLGLPR